VFIFFILAKIPHPKKCWVRLVLQSRIDYRDPSGCRLKCQKKVYLGYSTFGFFVWNYYHSVLDISLVVIPNHLDSNSLSHSNNMLRASPVVLSMWFAE
jgi:hypothetical protein